jgi:hypothetical protein
LLTIRRTLHEENAPMAHMVQDSRYKKEMEGLDEPPFDSDFGNKVYHYIPPAG